MAGGSDASSFSDDTEGGFESEGVEVTAMVVCNLSLSFSGGGVGGKTLRWIGGSDCCLDRLCRFGLTRLEAPKDMDSGSRSSGFRPAAACKAAFFVSGPVT